MKMIEVLQKVANGEIKDQTTLEIYDNTGDIYTYTFDEKFKAFYDECDDELGGDFEISNKFLNYEVELIPPKEKKYFVKFNMRGLQENEMYLNYQTENDYVFIYTTQQSLVYKTHFAKSELQSIRSVREFLEDMQGKYELIEVDKDESMDS